MRRVILTTSLIFIFILIGTVIAIFYAQGYRILSLNKGTMIAGTGLLVITSQPDGARVMINGHFTTATDNTINLTPGTYNIEIQKDGYFPWHKHVTVKEELVSQASATLFPIAPQLEGITSTGASNPVLDATGSLIAYTTASASADGSKNGIYLLDMNAKPIFPLGSSITQLVDDSQDSFSSSLLSFSPDGRQLLATVSGRLGETTYLINPGSGQPPQDVTATLPSVQQQWDQEQTVKDQKLITSLPRGLRETAQADFTNMALSPDENRLLYTASASATLPIIISPRLQAVDSTPEVRTIKTGNVYVYDIKEDRNFLIFDSKNNTVPAPSYRWHPDSSHLIFITGQDINIMDYDGINSTTIYAGPFANDFAYPTPDGSSVVILTNLNIPDAPMNLYKISLK